MSLERVQDLTGVSRGRLKRRPGGWLVVGVGGCRLETGWSRASCPPSDPPPGLMLFIHEPEALGPRGFAYFGLISLSLFLVLTYLPIGVLRGVRSMGLLR